MSSPHHVWELSRTILGDHRGVIVVLSVYMDESGTHDGSPVVTVGAFVATPRQWKLWTKDWNATKGPVKVFHSTDCEAFKGEFEGWDAPKRDAYVAELLPIMPRFNLRGLVLGINLDDYNAAMKGRDDLRELLGDPYTTCFYWSVTEMLGSFDAGQRIAFVHENNGFQGEVLEAFAKVQANFEAKDRTSLAFGSKAQYTPLQAADIIAFEGNKKLRGPLSRPTRRAWTAMDPPVGGPRLVIKYFNRENLPLVVESLSQIKAHNDRISAALSASSAVPPSQESA